MTAAMVLTAALSLALLPAFSVVAAGRSAMTFRAALIRAAPSFIAVIIPALLFIPIVWLKIPFEEAMAGQVHYLPQPLTLAWQTPMMMAASLGLAASLLICAFPAIRPRLIDGVARRPALVLTILVVAWIVVMSYLDIEKNANLHGGANLALFADSLRNITAEEGPLYSHMFQGEGSSLLGVHASFIWYFVYPFFRIWPTSEWLLILSNIALGLAAVPAYLLARQFFGQGLSLMVALWFLINRVVVAQPALSELTEERFLPVMLISAIYFVQTKRFFPFMVFAFLALTVREDVGIVLALLGLVSLIRRRKAVWWLLPMLFGLTWFFVMHKWMIPSLNPMEISTRPLIIYQMYGDSLSEIITTLLLNPQIALGTIFSDTPHLLTLFYLWQTYGFGVPVLSWEFIVAVPALAETLLIRDPYPDHINMPAVAAAATPAFIIGLATLERFVRRRWNLQVATVLMTVTLFAAVALTYSWFSPEWYQPRYNYETAMKVMEQVPEDATVMMPMYLTYESKPTQTVSSYYQVPYEISRKGYLEVEEEYIILDERTFPAYGRNFNGYVILRDVVLASPDFVRIFEGDDLLLYRRADLNSNPQTASIEHRLPPGGN